MSKFNHICIHIRRKQTYNTTHTRTCNHSVHIHTNVHENHTQNTYTKGPRWHYYTTELSDYTKHIHKRGSTVGQLLHTDIIGITQTTFIKGLISPLSLTVFKIDDVLPPWIGSWADSRMTSDEFKSHPDSPTVGFAAFGQKNHVDSRKQHADRFCADQAVAGPGVAGCDVTGLRHVRLFCSGRPVSVDGRLLFWRERRPRWCWGIGGLTTVWCGDRASGSGGWSRGPEAPRGGRQGRRGGSGPDCEQERGKEEQGWEE